MNVNLPTALTVVRLAAAPAVPLAFLLLPRPAADWTALALFIGAALTDWLDGILARAWDQHTRLGAMLDPIADKAMVVIALATLLAVVPASGGLLLPAALILFREVFVSGLREYLGAAAGTLAVTRLAKWKTTAQMVAIAALFAAGALGPDTVRQAGVALLWVAAVLTAITGWDYYRKARPYLLDEEASR